ncbi:hypothetical protein [Bacteroides sp. 51]|uniref:hypothetical protein n=1 Tax=Bacteroides sp. 51 TaxID=2302938 RepID=UPI0013D7CF17|nr:hypothetical protein [Bacteroides sp. 51]NDV81382.1 hypothetical protein [Bacteroides sp. 51]
MMEKLLSISVIALFLAIQDVNCNESRTELMNVNEEARVANRCVKHQTDANYFRAHGAGAGRHQNTAKVKAKMAANSELSNTIQYWMSEFMSKYVGDLGQNAEEYILHFEANSKEAIERIISENAVVACDEVEYVKEDGMYNVSLMIEIKRKKVFEAFNRILSTDYKWKDIYNQQKLEDLFKTGIAEVKRGK